MTQPVLRMAQPGGWRFLCPKDISGGPKVLASKQAEFSLVPGQLEDSSFPTWPTALLSSAGLLGTWVTESPA